MALECEGDTAILSQRIKNMSTELQGLVEKQLQVTTAGTLLLLINCEQPTMTNCRYYCHCLLCKGYDMLFASLSVHLSVCLCILIYTVRQKKLIAPLFVFQ